MISINSIAEYLAECKNQFTEINRTVLLFDDGDIVNFMKDHKESDNIFMIGIIPQFDSSGTHMDNLKFNNNLAFLFLEKISYKIIHDQSLLVFHRTLELAKKFVSKLKEESGESSCHEMDLIEAGSIGINPVMNLASCNGWEVEFSLKTGL